ncbi:nucleoid-associated protein, partial [Paenibacillus larvae]
AMNMAPFIFWNLAFYTIIRTQLVNERLHKCAFIKLSPTLWEDEFHLKVLDKQQVTGEVSKYFLLSFLESQALIDNKAMTELVSVNLAEYAIQEQIIRTQLEIVDFNAKVDRLLSKGNDVDLDRDLDNLFKTYIAGDADRVNKIDGFKQKLVQKRENVMFEFVAEKRPTIAMFADPDRLIKIQFPLQDMDTKVFLEYKKEEDGSVTTIIKIKGVELKEKFK